MTIKQNGGKVLTSGGFGCIFKPALKCDTAKTIEDTNTNTNTNNTDTITKLMTIKNATDEFKL